MAININIPSQVKTYADFATLPVSGEDKTIYITEDDNKTYRWDGATYVEISAGGLTVGTSPITSGTAGRILFEGAGNVLQESSNLFWDNTNGRLGIGTSTPANPLDVSGKIRGTGSGATDLSSTIIGAAFQTEYSNNPSVGTLTLGTLLACLLYTSDAADE